VEAHANVEFIGEIAEHEKRRFLGQAAALLFPIDWPEPFGLRHPPSRAEPAGALALTRQRRHRSCRGLVPFWKFSMPLDQITVCAENEAEARLKIA
jgi:glycosyltransferase involved in cell wall biosynthesis